MESSLVSISSIALLLDPSSPFPDLLLRYPSGYSHDSPVRFSRNRSFHRRAMRRRTTRSPLQFRPGPSLLWSWPGPARCMALMLAYSRGGAGGIECVGGLAPGCKLSRNPTSLSVGRSGKLHRRLAAGKKRTALYDKRVGPSAPGAIGSRRC
ncbi:uncharacterized protein VTP21DRAFT_7413 [Calcarisporiella thermophila]|uniref:uncharacterized protein n=1 Tax=Calcarisporiella thermophila TaxID=911321 RepID=UPI0037432375